jgi:spore maturation protein CgeB
MRVAVLDPYYANFLHTVYEGRQDLAALPYQEQRDELLAQLFGTFDAYSHGLRAAGHDAQEIITNNEPLQRRWAAEAGMRVPRRRPLEAILTAQVDVIDPDVVYIQNMGVTPRRLLDRWRSQGRLVVGQIAVAPPGRRVLRGYDLIVTSFPHYVDRFRELGVRSEYLPLAFDQRVCASLGPVEPRWDAVFVGGLDPRVHPAGVALIEAVAEPLDLQLWGYGLPERSRLRKRYHGELWGLDMYRVLASSRVVVNRHIEAAEGHANNMRLFEATGVGAALVTDRGSNLADLFEPGREVATYGDADELIAVVRGLLADEGERSALARAGQERTLSDHTYERRMADLARMLELHLVR